MKGWECEEKEGSQTVKVKTKTSFYVTDSSGFSVIFYNTERNMTLQLHPGSGRLKCIEEISDET